MNECRSITGSSLRIVDRVIGTESEELESDLMKKNLRVLIDFLLDSRRVANYSVSSWPM